MKTLNLTKAQINEREKSKTKVNKYQHAEDQMQFGKQLVIGGFILSIIGIIAYCVVCFDSNLNQQFGGVLLDNPGTLLVPTMVAIGCGTLLWIIGTFIHLKGAMASDPKKTEY